MWHGARGAGISGRDERCAEPPRHGRAGYGRRRDHHWAERKAGATAAALANRHGLITGATGTGKTVTLQILAEGLSTAGVPVFVADVKGDLSGHAAAGRRQGRGLVKRAAEIGMDRLAYRFPVVFWDLFGQ